MRTYLRCVWLVALLVPALLRGQSTSVNDPALWTFYGTCAHPTAMVVELRADEHLIQRRTVRFCHLLNARDKERGFRLMMSSLMRGGRTFQGEYVTTRSETIHADVWQAGADSDAVILGVSFANKRQIFLNTLHILMPGKARTDTLDLGLTIASYPVRPRQPYNER
jgi:hypothetical protein